MFSIAGLARVSARHPWRILAAWLLVLVLAGIAATGLGDALTYEGTFTNKPESVRADDLLTQRLRGGQDPPVTETVIVHSDTATVDDPAFRQVVAQTAAALRALPAIVADVTTYDEAVAAGDPGAAGLVSADRHTALIPVTLIGDVDAAADHAEEYQAAVATQNRPGFRVLTVGDISIGDEFNKLAERDLVTGEGVGLLAALVVLVVVFGALVAAGVPIALALVAIVVAVGLTALVGRVMDLSFFVVNMITMIGLAVGIDYSLFIVSRYREERRRGQPKLEAIETAGGTASKAVFFSGATVVLALFGMFLIPIVVFRSLGAGAILVVVAAVAAALTLVPALLGLLGDRIDWPRRRRYDAAAVDAQLVRDAEIFHRGFWGRIARAVMARPVVAVVLAAGLLVAAAVPYLDLHRGQAGVESLPPSDVRTAYALLSRDFPAGRLAPVEVGVDGPRTAAVLDGIDRLVAATGQDPVFGPAEPTQWNVAGDLALVRIPLTVDSSSPSALAAVDKLRDELIPAAFANAPAAALVTGGPAFNADFEAVVRDYTPPVFAFVLGLSFLLLMLAFRSLVVPLKAIAMNLLSVGATYGLLVLVFQKGYGADFFGFQETPTIEAWVPIFLFCVLFGLSMDYHVFLLSRIREHYDATHDNRTAVAVGLQATAKIITGAALIMVAVFAGFAAGTLVMFQQMGFGLAVAVLLDATVVRSVLVPATMALLGDRNWYLPRWLAWLPDLRVERTAVSAPPAMVPAVTASRPGAGFDRVAARCRLVMEPALATHAAWSEGVIPMATSSVVPTALAAGDAAPLEAGPGGPAAVPARPATAAHPAGWTTGRIAALAIGTLLVLVAVVFLGAGGTALWADRTQREAGYATTDVHTFSTAGSALATERTELGSAGTGWLYAPGLLGEIRIRVTPVTSDAALFVGIGPAADVERYLAGVNHTIIADFWTDEVEVVSGGTATAAPGTQDFWVASSSGTGARNLTWDPVDGSWTVVVMNADGRPGIDVRADLGARVPALPWIALGVLVAGAVFMAGGALLIAGAVRRRGPSRARLA